MNPQLLLIGLLSFYFLSQPVFGTEQRPAACDEAETCVQEESVQKEGSGVVRISYEEFVRRRSSGEKFILLDVRPKPDFVLRHIPGAVSFPVSEMAYERVHERLLDKSIPIVVYCFSTKCPMSIKAAERLRSLGYDVVDYKGGLWEWLQKGNFVVSGEGELVQSQYYDEDENH